MTKEINKTSNEDSPSSKPGEEVQKVFTLEILPLIKHSQQQHGLRHGDYQRYRCYCKRRLRRLRKTLKFPQGDKRHFKRRDVTVAQFTGKRADQRYVLLPLISAERCWAYAMQLKQEANTEPRKRFHMVSKLRKACFYALQLQQLVNSECFDARSKLECEAYVSWIHGTLHFELQLWASSGEHLKRTQLVYEELAKALPDDEQEIYRNRINEFLPNLRYCAYNIGGATDGGSGKDDLLQHGLLDNLKLLVNQTKLNVDVSSQVFEWRGKKITVRNEKVRLFLLSSEEFDKTLENNKGKPEERITLIENVLIDCKDAIQAFKEEMRVDQKTRNLGQNPQAQNVQSTLSYLHFIRNKRTLQRNLCLVEQAKQNFVDPNSKQTIEAKSGNGGGDGKRVRPQDLARLYEIILQNVGDLQQIPHAEEDKQYEAEMQAWANTFKAFRCYYIALTLTDLKKWREAVALYERAIKYAQKALTQLKELGEDEFHMTEPLRQLVSTINSCKFQAHAHSVLSEEPAAVDKSATAPLNRKQQQQQQQQAPLFERLGQYKEDQLLNTKEPNVFKLTPDLEAIACKPLFFDLALSHVEMPSLDDKMETAGQESGSGITGFVKGFLGWGSKK